MQNTLDPKVIIEAITLIATIFLGFFGLIKYIVNNFNKLNRSFFDYIEKKNGHLERISDRFSATVEKNHDVIDELSKKVESMNQNDNSIVEALRVNGAVLERAVKVIELHEKKDIMKEMNIKEARDDARDDARNIN